MSCGCANNRLPILNTFITSKTSLKFGVLENYHKTGEEQNKTSYLSYYQIVRQKIRQWTYMNYIISEEGKVYLIFKIQKDGKIAAIRVDKSKTDASEKLINVGTEAIKSASPFPYFPDDLKEYPCLNFEIEMLFEIM